MTTATSARRTARRRGREAVRLTVRDALATIVLSAPGGNRLDADALAGLAAAADEIAGASAVRAVVVQGEGRSFCEGLAPGFRWHEGVPEGVAAVADLRVPVVAVLHGMVAGIGLALALACDLRLASTGTRLSAAAGEGGLGSGALPRLARIVGPARAAEMTLLDRAVGSRQALGWGLVTDVVAPARLRATVRRTVGGLVDRGPLAMRYAKEAVGRALDLPLDDGIRLEQDLYVLLQTTADRREGIDAFLHRRPPRFHGH